MTDVRASILARCDELARTAKAARWASGREDDDGEWDPFCSGVVHDSLMRRVTSPAPSWIPVERANAMGVHIATWDPATVFTLVDGARELCKVHRPVDDPDAYNFSLLPASGDRLCEGCNFTAEGRETYTIGTCPSLRATARMLGVEANQ